MSDKYIKRLWVYFMVLVLCLPVSILADVKYPLEPLDLSSPRATLKSFLTTVDTAFQLIRDEAGDTPDHVYIDRLLELGAQAESTLDLSEIPPAAHFELGRDRGVYLYEVLSRIEIPPESEIPGAAAYVAEGDDKDADEKPVSWTIPHTEITLERVKDGPHAGQFLFSSSTVARAEEFYKKTRTLPYRRDVPLENFAEMRHYLSVGGWMISRHTIERFPDWLKYSVYRQAVWKWIALIVLIVTSVVTVMVIGRLARRILSGHSGGTYLCRLVTPLVLFLMTPLVLNLANLQIGLTDWVSGGVTLIAEAVTYFSLVWVTWTGLRALAEAIIASPKIPDQSLNAHLLRLAAQTLGIVVGISIIIYVSNQLGAPVYSLVAGLGVGGIAVALAAQPTIENFIGSLNLFADCPVRVGDFCRYGEDPNLDWQRVGTIESIGLRSTKIRGIDHTVTTIPNAEFSKMHIINLTTRRHMLLLTILGLRYETTDDQLRFVLVTLREMLLAHPRVVENDPRVRFAGFGDFSLNVEIRVEINTSDRDEFRAIREDIYLRVMKIIKDSGTGFAFPSRTVYHTRDQGLDKERQDDAEAQVRAWCAAQELPFPNFTADYRKQNRNTLDYPPEGSPEASQ